MTKVLVLCHGNKWRSPFAAALLAQSSLISVRSAGFSANQANAAVPMRKEAEKIGLDLTEHRAKIIDYTLAQWAGVIVYMDNGNKRRLEAFLRQHALTRKTVCLAHYADPPQPRVPDPCFVPRGSKEFFDIVDLLKRSTEGLRAAIEYGDLSASR
jgi:protein-tyrosine-phosphatase